MIGTIIPKKGLKVRDPLTKKHLKEEGEDLEITAHWIRREMAGDVVIKRKDKLVEAQKQK